MPQTPDRFPGARIEEELQLEDTGLAPSVIGALTNNGGDLYGRDNTGVFNLRSGLGITASQHETLHQLIHFIDDGPAYGFTTGAYREILPAADPFPTSIIWYWDNTKAEKYVEKTITYTGVLPTTVVWEMYDTDGSTVIATVTDTITYSGVFETSRTRAIA